MSKVVAFISGGVVQYVGSNLENVEIVVVDADNLSEMGYTDADIQKILERETIGINEKEMIVPPEATELMEVQPYQAPEPWAPKPQEWCWTEVEGSLEFKLSKFEGYKEGQKYYKFDGVLPMAEVLGQQERINHKDVISALREKANPDFLMGDYWQKIDVPVPDAPNGFDVNVWDDGYALKMTAYAMLKGDDGILRTSTLHPLMTHTFTAEEINEIEFAIGQKYGFLWSNERTGEKYTGDYLGRASTNYNEVKDETIIYLGGLNVAAMTVSGQIGAEEADEYLKDNDWSVMPDPNASIKKVASEATKGKSLLDAIEELEKSKTNPEPKA